MGIREDRFPAGWATSISDPVGLDGCSPVRVILLLAANPKGTPQLRLDEEVKKIKQLHRRSLWRDEFDVVTELAVTDNDLRRAMLDHEPEIVHFLGHGTGSGQDCSERN